MNLMVPALLLLSSIVGARVHNLRLGAGDTLLVSKGADDQDEGTYYPYAIVDEVTPTIEEDKALLVGSTCVSFIDNRRQYVQWVLDNTATDLVHNKCNGLGREELQGSEEDAVVYITEAVGCVDCALPEEFASNSGGDPCLVAAGRMIVASYKARGLKQRLAGYESCAAEASKDYDGFVQVAICEAPELEESKEYLYESAQGPTYKLSPGHIVHGIEHQSIISGWHSMGFPKGSPPSVSAAASDA